MHSASSHGPATCSKRGDVEAMQQREQATLPPRR